MSSMFCWISCWRGVGMDPIHGPGCSSGDGTRVKSVFVMAFSTASGVGSPTNTPVLRARPSRDSRAVCEVFGFGDGAGATGDTLEATGAFGTDAVLASATRAGRGLACADTAGFSSWNPAGGFTSGDAEFSR